MKEDYKRLMIASEVIKGITRPSDLAELLTRQCFSVKPSVIGNWKTRGISTSGKQAVARILDCRVEYLESGKLPIQDDRSPETPVVSTFERITLLVSAMNEADQLKLLHFLEIKVVFDNLGE